MIDVIAGLEGLAADRPRDHALRVEGGDDLTFGEWERRSGRLARGLADRGVGPGDRVALRFDAAHWAGFAIAYVGVLKAGAVAALVPAGLAPTDATRVLRHCEAAGVLCPSQLEAASSRVWVADPSEVEAGETAGAVPGRRPVDPAAVAELAYPLAPMARPRPLVRTLAELAPPPLDRPGWAVHSWAPGSEAGQSAVAWALAGRSVATLARFSPEAFAALVAGLEAVTCGLSPGLASALVASGAIPAFDLGSVSTVALSGGHRGSRVGPALAAAFPRATVSVLDEQHRPPSAHELSPAPAGASQLGMLWHEQLVPGSFNLPSLVRRYRGGLDVDALERALAELVRRHEPLRTTFELAAGAPQQVVAAPSFRLPVVDLARLPPADRDAEVGRLIAQASSRPFDLVDEPLFAPRLVRLGADDHVLVVRVHHTAFDDWSVDVLRRQLSALYSSCLEGGPSPLPEPATRFVDVCRRQRARLDGAAGEEQRAYWRAVMEGAPFAVQLRLGERHQIGPDRPGAGEPLHHDLPPDVVRDLRALAAGLRATPFMTVLAAFAVVLARRTRQDDLVLASVVAARGATELESMIGCFTKKVLLRLRLDGDPTFAEMVARTRAGVLGALAHQDLPFEAVVQDTLGPAAAAHGLAPQVPVVVQGETPQQARLVLPGVEVGPFEVPVSARRERHFSATDDDAGGDPRPAWGDGAYLGTFLLLSLLDSGRGLGFVARGVFHRPAAQLLLEELESLLREVAASPDRALSELVPGGAPAADGDELVLRGLRLRRSRLEAALRGCPGVADVAVALDGDDGAARLMAYVVPGRDPPPTLAQLRRALWGALPGSPWPAAAALVDEISRSGDGTFDPGSVPGRSRPLSEAPDPNASLLTAIWAGAGAEEATPSSTYWQDFTFLPALAAARAAGLPLTDEQVSRCRTPEMLAAMSPPPPAL